MATSAAAAVAIARRKVVEHFFAVNAVTPETAIPYASGRRLRERQFERLRGEGVIREAGAGLFYVDIPAWQAWQHRMRRLFQGILLASLLVLGAVLFFTVGKS